MKFFARTERGSSWK